MDLTEITKQFCDRFIPEKVKFLKRFQNPLIFINTWLDPPYFFLFSHSRRVLDFSLKQMLTEF